MGRAMVAICEEGRLTERKPTASTLVSAGQKRYSVCMEKNPMTQKLPRLYKVKHYGFDFVLADSVDEAETAEININLAVTANEITEMRPTHEGYSWKPLDAKSGAWQKFTCGEWLEQTAEACRREEKTRLREAAMAKLTQEEQAAILEWAVGFK